MTKYLFDPGYGQHLVSLVFSLEDIYAEINKFKNLGQKKFQFKQYYPSILKILKQNTDFYLGCLLWAVYISSQPEGELENNFCYGKEFDEDKSLIELLFLIKFLKTFSKDTKYYLGQEFKYDEKDLEMLEVYREFALMNKAFTQAKLNKDLTFPKSIKTPSAQELEQIKSVIEKAVQTGEFDILNSVKGYIL
jgi:hypothetical protein